MSVAGGFTPPGKPHSSQVERALSLLVNASRVSPPLREAVFTVEAHLVGLRDDLIWYRQAFHKHVDEIDRLRSENEGLRVDLAWVNHRIDDMEAQP